jgi:RNA-dependent RNA polymerase
MCSGGDLDGDDYMVLWDSDLTPETINVLPMDFTPEKPIEKEGPITAADISEFFVTYMKNDSLGQIAHAHLAQADFNAEGVNSHECIKLAQLHSQAVDYPKSGIPAKMERELRPKRWPHFMEKKHLQERQIYTSKKILGMLYDQVQLVDFKPQWENPFDPRILRFRAFELDDPMLKEVAEIKVSYDEALRRLMAKHGIRTEFEAWSVFVLEHNHESRDYKFSEEFGRTIAGLKAQFIGVCRAAAGMTSVTGGWNQLGPFVAAMYTVTAREMDQALKECSGGIRTMDSEHMPLISFPWLFPSELGKIATGSSVRQPIPMHQGVSHRPRKVVDTDREEPVGIVQTEAGITHYGELLNLDFGFTKSISNLAEEQRSKSYGEEQKQRSQQETETAKGTEECDRMEGGQTGLSGLRRKSSRDTAKGASS